MVVVGPEGGLTDDEVAAFDAAGARAVRLGAEVLRTSTAGVAAVAALLSADRRAGADPPGSAASAGEQRRSTRCELVVELGLLGPGQLAEQLDDLDAGRPRPATGPRASRRRTS